MTFKTFEDLEVWKLSRELANDIYSITSKDLFKKDFELKNQIRSASISILSNIAEGFERDSTKEFVRFLNISKGSAGEVRAQLYIALDQKYISSSEFQNLINQVTAISKSLKGFINYLKTKTVKLKNS